MSEHIYNSHYGKGVFAMSLALSVVPLKGTQCQKPHCAMEF